MNNIPNIPHALPSAIVLAFIAIGGPLLAGGVI